jgi:hypothetical protein
MAQSHLLDPAKGYALERKGANGFTCYVERTDYLREDYGNGFIVPECQDPEGSRTIVPVEFDVERLRAEGKLSPAELKKEIERRFKAGEYHAPARPGIVYMLSPVARLYGDPNSRTTVANEPSSLYVLRAEPDRKGFWRRAGHEPVSRTDGVHDPPCW